MTTDVIGLEGLAAVIQEMAASRRTGTLFVRGQDGHMSMIAFDGGTLVSVSRGGQRGTDALPLVMEFTGGTYSIADTVLGRPQPGLPTAEQFVALLKGTSPEAPASAEQTSAVSTAEVSPARTLPSDRAFERIGQVLVDYIGPIGAMLCKRKAAKLGGQASYDSAWSVVSELANDVDGIGERENFLMRAERILQEYSNS